MKAYFDIDENGRVVGYGSSPITSDAVELELPEDHEAWRSPLNYVLDGDSLIHDEAYAQELADEQEALDNRKPIQEEVESLKSLSSALIGGEHVDEVTAAKQLNKALCMFANTLPEEEALVIASIFPEWEPTRNYKKDEYLRYGLNADNEPQIFRVVQPHTSQSDWAPNVAASLFSKVGFTETGAAIWIQPMGAHDAYAKDDEVVHNGKTYVSNVSGNVWEPGIYGWTEKVGGAGTAASAKTVK